MRSKRCSEHRLPGAAATGPRKFPAQHQYIGAQVARGPLTLRGRAPELLVQKSWCGQGQGLASICSASPVASPAAFPLRAPASSWVREASVTLRGAPTNLNTPKSPPGRATSRPDGGSLPPRPHPAPPLEPVHTGCPLCRAQTARRRPTCQASTPLKPIKSLCLPSCPDQPPTAWMSAAHLGFWASLAPSTILPRPRPHVQHTGCPLTRGRWPTPRPGVFAWHGP